jgi:hypothetical protein
MTAAAIQRPEPYEVPEGGLGSFLTATVGDWSDEALNADNYYDVVKPTADQLAQFGREEDDRIAHVATGETIIPMAVFEEDPALKEAVFNRMMEMGIDPERYIVGNELNSINPVTGQPEFFLKKIFKGIKKAVKGVVKVFKKVAPIVLSTVGYMVAGPIGAALGSGIGTLIQGGDLKDAFKAAAISGITAGVTQGIGQGFEAAGQATGGFGAKVSAGVRGFGESVSSGLSGGYVDQFAQGFSNLTGQTAAQAAAPKTPMTASDAVADAFGPVGTGPDGITYAAGPSPYAGDPLAMASNMPPVGPVGSGNIMEEVVVKGKNLSPKAPSVADAATQTAAQTAAQSVQKLDPTVDLEASGEYKPSDESILDQLSNRAFRGGLSKDDVLNAKLRAYDARLKELKTLYPDISPELADKIATKAYEAAGPGFLTRYGPTALGITGLAAATGAFDVPPMEPLEGGFGMTGMDLLAANPLKYRTYAQAGSGYNPPPVGVAGGGGMDTRSFPRRDGAISGPGTETSDDIPAMLSDGEFVMTARAVRGAGNGSRERGMRRMYDMMSQFERAV